jgi:hypothetical protein
VVPDLDRQGFGGLPVQVKAWAGPWNCSMKIMGAVVMYTVSKAS